jgi:hypothetical protein
MRLNLRKHLSEGQLRAYEDNELDHISIGHVRQHLVSCESCRGKAATIYERAGLVGEQFERTSTENLYLPDGPSRNRLEVYISSKEVQPMFKKFVSRQPRLVFSTVLLLVLISSMLAFPQVRAIATNFLGLFRVEKIAAVPINLANIPDDISQAVPRIEKMLADDMVVEEFGEVYEVESYTEASAAAGIPVRLPYSLGEPDKMTVQPGARLTFTVDLPRMRAILDEMGRQDVELPQLLNGQTVTAEVPASVTAMYGDCNEEVEGYDPDGHGKSNSNCMVLIQLVSPTISAPPGLDINKIGTTYLELTGMSAEEAERFSQTVDWASTLVIPVPNYSSSTEVLVDGVQGVWVNQPERGDNSRFMLAWVKNGIVYSLSGRGPLQEAVHIANSLN